MGRKYLAGIAVAATLALVGCETENPASATMPDQGVRRTAGSVGGQGGATTEDASTQSTKPDSSGTRIGGGFFGSGH